MLRYLLLSLCLMLSACSQGPDGERLQQDLQERLDQVFGAGSVSISQLQRRGSASDAHADSDSSLAYLQHTQARAVLIRPDRYVYGIAKQDSDIAPLLASWQQQYAPHVAAVSV